MGCSFNSLYSSICSYKPLERSTAGFQTNGPQSTSYKLNIGRSGRHQQKQRRSTQSTFQKQSKTRLCVRHHWYVDRWNEWVMNTSKKEHSSLLKLSISRMSFFCCARYILRKISHDPNQSHPYNNLNAIPSPMRIHMLVSKTGCSMHTDMCAVLMSARQRTRANNKRHILCLEL